LDTKHPHFRHPRAALFGRDMAFLPKTPFLASFGKTGILFRTFWTRVAEQSIPSFRDPFEVVVILFFTFNFQFGHPLISESMETR